MVLPRPFALAHEMSFGIALVAAAPALGQAGPATVDCPDTAIGLDFGEERDAAIAAHIEAALDGYDRADVAVTSGVVTLTRHDTPPSQTPLPISRHRF